MSSSRISTGPFGAFAGTSNKDELTLITPSSMLASGDIVSRSYTKLVASMGAAVQLGVATAEGREALEMIEHRLSQMANFTRHIFTGRFGLAAADIGLDWNLRSVRRKIHTPLPLPKLLRTPSGRARESTRSLSNIYLEFHFGWAPLLRDIHDAMDVIQKPLRPALISGRAMVTYVDPSSFPLTTSTDGTWNYSDFRTGTYTQTLTQRAEVIMINPNLEMMQRIGVLNPLSIAWELVPFSFVLDWFVTVGDYLGSLTDFAGVQLLNPSQTLFTRYSGSRTYSSTAIHPLSNNSAVDSWTSTGVWCTRQLGITGPSIRLKSPKAWGYRRGLAAVSLLLQRFPRQVVQASAIHIARKRTEFRQNVFPEFYGKYF